MSKTVRDLLQEIRCQGEIEDDFLLYVLKVKVDENGEVQHSGEALSVSHIEIDTQDQECLLHYADSTIGNMTVAMLVSALSDELSDFEVCAALESEVDGSHIRADSPLIGFGESIEQKYFFLVCHA